MGSRKKKGFWGWVRMCVLITIAAALLAAFFAWLQCRSYEKQMRSSIGSLLAEVVKQYPDIREEELIAVLNRETAGSDGEKLLNQYGITKEVAVIAAMEREKRKTSFAAGLGALAAGALLLLAFYLYIRERERRLSELTGYMRKLSRRDYNLALIENSEDELSHLQNELYKVTVMLKEAAERDRLQRQAVQESVSDISHQLKTPLTSVQILLDNLMEDGEMEEQMRFRFLKEISRQMEGVNWLIGALLKLSRLEADVVEFAHERILVADMMEIICQKLAVLAEVKEVELILRGKTKVFIWGDLQWNTEALLNIVKNAIEHSRSHTAVTITVAENDVYTEVVISDCGEGIAPEEIKHIFDRFYRAGNAAKDSVGIGLAMAKAIIEKQGGYIMADSKEGEGTTFTIKYMKYFTESPKSHFPSLQ